MGRLDTAFAAPFVEVAVDSAAARERKQEQLARVPELLGDVDHFGHVADSARLARSYARASDAAYLLREYAEAAELSSKAKTIFDAWNKSGATFLNELRLTRARVQMGEFEVGLRWYDEILGSSSRDLELYLDWIDIGYIECLVAAGEYERALVRYDEFYARWSQRPNVNIAPYVEARDLLLCASNSSD